MAQVATAMTPDSANADATTAPPPVLAKSVGPLVVAVALANVAGIGGAAAVLVLIDRPDWFRPLWAVAALTVLASALSLVPQVWGLRRSLEAAVATYFVAMGVRLFVSLGGGLLAVLVGKYPAAPTLLLMVGLYLVVLAAESAVVAMAAWRAGQRKV